MNETSPYPALQTLRTQLAQQRDEHDRKQADGRRTLQAVQAELHQKCGELTALRKATNGWGVY